MMTYASTPIYIEPLKINYSSAPERGGYCNLKTQKDKERKSHNAAVTRTLMTKLMLKEKQEPNCTIL